jgi:DNA-binding response OmpR family regulator
MAAERVDALLLDLHLGPVDARPLAAELRRDHPQLGIVLMTGSSDSEIQSVAADAVLVKPFDLDVFRSVVALAAGARRPQV